MMGEVIIEPQYEKTWLFSDLSQPRTRCMAKFQEKGKIGYYGSNMKVMIQPQYIDGTDFNRGYAIVSTPDSSFVIDVWGNWASSEKYDPTKNEIGWKMIRKSHSLKPIKEEIPSWINENDFDNVFLVDTIIPNYSVRYYIVEKGGKQGLYIQKKLELEPIYDSIKAFHRKTFLTYKDGKIGILDFRNNTKAPYSEPIYDEVRVMRKTGDSGSKHYVLYRKDSLWGIIRGTAFTPTIYKKIDICRKHNMLLWVTTVEGNIGLISDEFHWIYFSEEPPLKVE